MADLDAPDGGGGTDDGGSDGGDTGGGDGRFGDGSAYDVAFTAWGALASFLKENFLDSNNRIEWKGLGTGLIGGLVLAVWQGLIGIPLAVGEAIRRFTTPITSALDGGAAELATEIQLSAIQVWDFANVGFASVFVNLAAALAAGAIIAWGVN